jgi:iron-sulfur cluster assembly protein CyaY
MDESRYEKLADAAYRRVGDAFEDVDPGVVDCEIAGDVVTLTFKGGQRCILNTQRPTRQLWLAAVARAWHFAYDEATGRWMDDKGQGVELFAQIKTIVRELAGIEVPL